MARATSNENLIGDMRHIICPIVESERGCASYRKLSRFCHYWTLLRCLIYRNEPAQSRRSSGSRLSSPIIFCQMVLEVWPAHVRMCSQIKQRLKTIVRVYRRVLRKGLQTGICSTSLVSWLGNASVRLRIMISFAARIAMTRSSLSMKTDIILLKASLTLEYTPEGWQNILNLTYSDLESQPSFWIFKFAECWSTLSA